MLSHKCTRPIELRLTAIRARGDLQQRRVVPARRVAVAGEFGRASRAVDGAEAARLGLLHSLELAQRRGVLAGLEQRLGQQLARRRKRARRDDVLLRPALPLGRVAQRDKPSSCRPAANTAQPSADWRWMSTCSAQ